MSTNLDFEWRESIREIPREAWETCFKGACFARTYEYQSAVEDSGAEGVSYHHLLVRRGGKISAIIGCFRYRLPLAVIATGTMRKTIGAVEKILPNLFTVNTFFCGQLTATCDHLFGLDAIDDDVLRRRVLHESERKIRERSRELGCKLTVVKEIPAGEIPLYASAFDDEAIFVDSLPNTFLSFDPSTSYFEQIRSKYRNLYKKRRRAFEERGLRWQIVDGPISPELAADMERLYLRVMQRSKNQFERMPAGFFAKLCEGFDPAFAILCLDGDRVVGFSINLEEKHRVCGLYLGYEDDDGRGQIYFNLLYKVIEVAMERGQHRLQLGQTSYEIKSALGATAVRTYLVMHSRHRAVRFLLRELGNELFPRVRIPQRKVFSKNFTRAARA